MTAVKAAKTEKKPAAKRRVAVKAVKKVIKVPVEKPEPAIVEKPEEAPADDKKKIEYLVGIGRRKSARARVLVFKNGEGRFTINNKDFKQYFPTLDLQERVLAPFKVVGQMDRLELTAKVEGGGVSEQADAVRHGASRALLLFNPNFKKPLKKAGLLTRDPRKKERKKPGLKRARKRPQWAKR